MVHTRNEKIIVSYSDNIILADNIDIALEKLFNYDEANTVRMLRRFK